ncbi:MAG: ArsR/SmtB family transcription factor [Usitatibacter sp.]
MNAKLAVASLAALAQESRLLIFRLLVEAGPTGLSVGEIGSSLRVAPATLSFHLKELSHARLVRSRQDGRFIHYSANFGRMNGLLGYLSDNCCARERVDCDAGCGGPKRLESASRAASKPAGGRGAIRRVRRDTSKT